MIFNILTKNCALMFLLFRLLIQDLTPHMVGAFEDFSRQMASPGSGVFIEIGFATNPHPYPGWEGGGGLH